MKATPKPIETRHITRNERGTALSVPVAVIPGFISLFATPETRKEKQCGYCGRTYSGQACGC